MRSFASQLEDYLGVLLELEPTRRALNDKFKIAGINDSLTAGDAQALLEGDMGMTVQAATVIADHFSTKIKAGKARDDFIAAAGIDSAKSRIIFGIRAAK